MSDPQIDLRDGENGVCPYCAGESKRRSVVVYIEVIYIIYTCRICSATWRRVFHYIGFMERSPSFYDNPALVKLIKEGAKKLKKKYDDSPAEYKR